MNNVTIGRLSAFAFLLRFGSVGIIRSMTRRKLWMTSIAAAAALTAITFASAAGPAEGANRPATGVGSCTLKGWNPTSDLADAENLPVGHRPQSYKPDNYNCTGAVFAKPGVEFAKFPQPHDYRITNRHTTRLVRTCKPGACTEQKEPMRRPAAAMLVWRWISDVVLSLLTRPQT